jgi:hypothetical protein
VSGLAPSSPGRTRVSNAGVRRTPRVVKATRHRLSRGTARMRKPPRVLARCAGPGARRTPHASHRCRETHAGVVKLLDTSVSFTAQAAKLSPPTAAASDVGHLLDEPGVRASRSNRCLSRPELPEKLTSQGRCRPSVKGANCRPCAMSPPRGCALPATQVLGLRRLLARIGGIALVCRGRERVCPEAQARGF